MSNPWNHAIRIVILLGILFFPSCKKLNDNQPHKVKQTRLLMDTFVEITVIHDNKKAAEQSINAVFDEMKRIEDLMSKFKGQSEISAINRNAGGEYRKVSPEVFEVVHKAVTYSEITGGRFDITVGALMNKVWRFNEDEKSLPKDADIKRLLPMVDYRKIRLKDENMVSLKENGMFIDVGGIAKGYAVDKGIELLQSNGIHNAIINAGGDLRAMGKRQSGKAWRIGIQHPRTPSEMLEVLEVNDIAIATSGDYQRYFEKDGKRYHHILDPKTGWPAMGNMSVTIAAKDAMTADAIATAVFIMRSEDGLIFIEKMPGVEGVIVTLKGEKMVSSGMKIELNVRSD